MVRKKLTLIGYLRKSSMTSPSSSLIGMFTARALQQERFESNVIWQFKIFNRNFRYNKKFTMRDLKRFLKTSNNSSPGPDQIHYEILRHLPIETLHILLNIINETWKGTHSRNHGEKLSLYQFPNLERILLILLIKDLLLSQVAYVKRLKGWWMSALFGI